MIEFFPVKVVKQKENFPLVECILRSLKRNKITLRHRDVLAISSKFVALSEGRIVRLADVKPGKRARKLAKENKMPPELVELILKESDAVLCGVYGFLLAVKDNMIAPNAGIDKSNIYPGYAVLYPKDPFASAEKLRKDLLRKTGKKLGIVLTDSRLMPTRIGTTGVAVACAGFEPVDNCIGRKDLFGNVLKFTKRALADDIASGAELLMGEADESIPVVVIRPKKAAWRCTERKIKKNEMRMDWKKDIYILGLSR